MDLPILGLCYGMQLLCAEYGGSVVPAAEREYGRAILHVDCQDELFAGLPTDTGPDVGLRPARIIDPPRTGLGEY